MAMCGGVGVAKKATSEVQELCDQLKAEVEGKCGKNFSQFIAITYKTQLVSGTNYFVKLDTGDDGFIHVRIYTALPHTKQPPTVHSVQQDKTEEDELAYF